MANSSAQSSSGSAAPSKPPAPKPPSTKASAKKSRPPRKIGKRAAPGVPLALWLSALVLFIVAITAGSIVAVSSNEGQTYSRQVIASDLGGSQNVQTAFQQQRYQRLNLISRIFATDQVLTSYLAAAAQARDQAAILASVEEYQNLLTFDLAVVMDRDGVVLTRTDDRTAAGENLAATPLIAVALAEDKASGVWRQGDQLYHAVAVPLVRQFDLVGYIAVAYAINNTLAIQVQRAGGAEMVFLSSTGTGPTVSAATLGDAQSQNLIEALRKAGGVLDRVMNQGDTANDVELDLDGEDWVAFLSPLRDADGGSVGAVVALTSVADRLDPFERIRLLALGAGLLALLAGLAGAYLLARRVQQPTARVADAVEQVAKGQWETPLPAVAGDAGRISNAMHDHVSQLREKSALEFVAGRVARLLPEPAKTLPQSKAQSAHACLVGIDLRSFADAKIAYDPEASIDRLNRDVQRLATSAASQQGKLIAVHGHRVLALFEGDNASYHALCAASEMLLTLSESDSVFDEPNPPVVALSSGSVILGSVSVGESVGTAVAGLPVQLLESLMREAAPGGIYFSQQVYKELAPLFQKTQVQVKGQRGILTPQPLYFTNADGASRATGAKALTDGNSQLPGDSLTVADLRAGMVLANRFELHSELGAGRMGRIFKAHDRDLGDLVTLKMLRPGVVQDAVQFERLKQAVARARPIRHPNVLSVLDFGEADRLPYIEMEFARGMTLDFVIEQARMVPVVAAVRIARQIAGGLAAGHGKQLMHGGLKPQNILLEPGGGVKVMDFGLGQPPRAGAEEPYPGFVSPEQLEGLEPDSRADFFAFGVVMYYALTGQMPFPGSSVGEVRQRMAGGPPAAPTSVVAEIPPLIEKVVLTCLAPNPEQRYQTIDKLIEDLERVRV